MSHDDLRALIALLNPERLESWINYLYRARRHGLVNRYELMFAKSDYTLSNAFYDVTEASL